jgi:hypothetical protein
MCYTQLRVLAFLLLALQVFRRLPADFSIRRWSRDDEITVCSTTRLPLVCGHGKLYEGGPIWRIEQMRT